MTFLKREAPSLLTLLFVAAASLAAYPWLPLRIPVHWGIDGTADTYAPRDWAVLLNPAGTFLVYGFFFFVRYADRARTSRLQDLGLFEPLRHGAVLFFGFCHALALGSGLGWVRPDVNLLPATVCFFTLVAGGYVPAMPLGSITRLLSAVRIETTADSRSALAWVLAFTGAAGLVGACAGRLLWLGSVLVAAIGIALLRRRYPEPSS